ncbi:hypothetical protein CY34DRAFT_283612 [Suillus luteus UH-Slu-Lm8-n1]|uniref:Uncharacterized protein n=1 Tax=Suillus luteus UH-Slu-Lm8-n1 TaxID=930992 RepID=A0A0D0AQ73_9AGAM|nr:hypothetical protein CY34DRAFT_283612 [Suillus luteus UH-Slu-Lm8-n1]
MQPSSLDTAVGKEPALRPDPMCFRKYVTHGWLGRDEITQDPRRLPTLSSDQLEVLEFKIMLRVTAYNILWSALIIRPYHMSKFNDQRSTLMISALAECPLPSLGPDLANVVFLTTVISVASLYLSISSGISPPSSVPSLSAYSGLFHFTWLLNIALLIFIIVSPSCLWWLEDESDSKHNQC